MATISDSTDGHLHRFLLHRAGRNPLVFGPPLSSGTGVLRHPHASCFRGFVLFCSKRASGLAARCLVAERGGGDGLGTVRAEAVCRFSRDETGNFSFLALLRSIYKNPEKYVISPVSQESY